MTKIHIVTLPNTSTIPIFLIHVPIYISLLVFHICYKSISPYIHGCMHVRIICCFKGNITGGISLDIKGHICHAQHFHMMIVFPQEAYIRILLSDMVFEAKYSYQMKILQKGTNSFYFIKNSRIHEYEDVSHFTRLTTGVRVSFFLHCRVRSQLVCTGGFGFPHRTCVS